MIGLDTNILARYYIDNENDEEAQKQQMASKRLFESGQSLKVSKTVILEFEWKFAKRVKKLGLTPRIMTPK